MPNSYYTFSPTFVPGTKVRSDAVNTQYQAIEAAFDLLPSDPNSLTTGVNTFAGTSSGTGNAYTVTMPNTRTANANGDEVIFVADRANTGAVTLQVDAISAVSLVRADGSALEANDIQIGLIYVCRYNAGNVRFQLIGPSASYLTNAAASAAAAAASAAAASTSASNAATSETNAATSESLAAEWASNAVDDDVTGSGGQFSALHWSAGAQDWATRAEDSLIPTNFGGNGVDDYSAFHWAQKAAASAGSIGADNMRFAGNHDASGGDPATPTDKPLYRISVDGTITGAGAVRAGDDIYYNGTDWNKISGSTAVVTSDSVTVSTDGNWWGVATVTDATSFKNGLVEIVVATDGGGTADDAEPLHMFVGANESDGLLSADIHFTYSHIPSRSSTAGLTGVRWRYDAITDTGTVEVQVGTGGGSTTLTSYVREPLGAIGGAPQGNWVADAQASPGGGLTTFTRLFDGSEVWGVDGYQSSILWGNTTGAASYLELSADTEIRWDGREGLNRDVDALALRYMDATNDSVAETTADGLRTLLTGKQAFNSGAAGSTAVATTPLGASTDSDQGFWAVSTTAGHQVGYGAYVNDGTNNQRVFFGMHDGDVWGLRSERGGGVERDFVMQSDGETFFLYDATDESVTLRYSDADALKTELLGARMQTTLADLARLDIYNSNGTSRMGYLEWENTVDGCEWTSELHGSPMLIRGENNSGTKRTGLTYDPDGGVDLGYTSTTNAFRTVAPSDGGAEANNTKTGGGLERVLTESDLSSGAVVKTSTDQFTTQTLTDDSELAGFALDASTTYLIEGYLLVDTSDFSNIGLDMAIQSSQTLSDSGWALRCDRDATTVEEFSAAGAAITVVAGVNFTSNSQRSITITGFVVTSTSAPTLDLQFRKDSATAGDVSVFPGSWLRFIPVI